MEKITEQYLIKYMNDVEIFQTTVMYDILKHWLIKNKCKVCDETILIVYRLFDHNHKQVYQYVMKQLLARTDMLKWHLDKNVLDVNDLKYIHLPSKDMGVKCDEPMLWGFDFKFKYYKNK